MLAGFEAGQKDVLRAIKRADFADGDITIDGSPTATAFFKFQAFTTAAVEDSRMRTRIKAALAGNLKRGEGQKSFTEVVNSEFDRAGRSRLKPYQVANIYETNTATAFSAGQMAKMLEVQEDFPFWEFIATMDSRTSPEHAALHGKIFRNGDFTFFPPLRHRCRCTARMLTARQAGKYPKSAMPGAYQRAELYVKAGNPEFAGHKQANYIAWLQEEYKNADAATRKLIDLGTQQLKKELHDLGKSMPKQSDIKTPETTAPEGNMIPAKLAPGSAYVKGTDIKFDENFFKLIDPKRPVKLIIEHGEDKRSSYRPGDRSVHLAFGPRAKNSLWYRERIVYHEFGHAIDWQRDIHNSQKMQRTLLLWQNKLSRPGRSGRPQIEEAHNRLVALLGKLRTMQDSTFQRRGITRKDVLEQVGATLDTIMAINPKYGRGHDANYYKIPGRREAEFLAHCFENRFAGNKVFEKFLPELYRQTLECIDELK